MMFQYVIVGWYILTIVLIASIVGYIAYYILQRFAVRRLKYKSMAQVDENDEDRPVSAIDEDVDVSATTDDLSGSENKDIVGESEMNENSGMSEENSEGSDDIIIMEEVIEFGPGLAEPEPEEEASLGKKHKVKNIAEGVSRDDILQDKHEKNLQKVKYEALLCKQRNDLAGYEKKLIEGLILDPDDIDIYRQLADFYFSEGKYTKALSMFRKILLFDPEDHHALWQIGEIYIEQLQYEDAQVFVEKALALSPDNPKYYISLIDITIAKEEFDQALVYLEKIVGLRPRNISYIMALGEMYEKLGRKEEAKTTYFRVLEIDPLHIDVKHILKRF